MGGFFCPNCGIVRHIDEEDDPRFDHCRFCGTTVPYIAQELARMRDEDERDTPSRGQNEHSADDLVGAYRKETCFCSSYAHARKVSPTHDKLVALGDEAVPALLRALESGEAGMHEMHLLATITEEWPAASAQNSVGDSGFVATNVAQARDLWVAWGHERGLI